MARRYRRKPRRILRLVLPDGRVARRCTTCFRFKIEDRYHFPTSRRTRIGYRAECRTCYNASHLAYYYQRRSNLLLSA